MTRRRPSHLGHRIPDASADANTAWLYALASFEADLRTRRSSPRQRRERGTV